MQSDEAIQKHDWSLINTSANCFDSIESSNACSVWLCNFSAPQLTSFYRWERQSIVFSLPMEKVATKVFLLPISHKIEKLMAVSLPIFNCCYELALVFYELSSRCFICERHSFFIGIDMTKYGLELQISCTMHDMLIFYDCWVIRLLYGRIRSESTVESSLNMLLN